MLTESLLVTVNIISQPEMFYNIITAAKTVRLADENFESHRTHSESSLTQVWILKQEAKLLPIADLIRALLVVCLA